MHLRSVGLIVEGKGVGLGHAQHLQTKNASHLLLIGKGGIGKLGEPRVVVKNGVIDAVRTVGADIGGGHAKMLQEGRIIRAAAEIANVHIAMIGVAAALGKRTGVGALATKAGGLALNLPGIVDGASLRAGHTPGNVAQKLFEAGNAGGPEVRTRDAHVHIEICYGVPE